MKTRLKIVFLFLCVFLLGVGDVVSQPPAYFVHYGSEDGLPQHTVTNILQDSKGFMWFSTWDGLSKFDGYTFTTYRLPSGQFESRSNRIDKLYEDKYNNIWILSYDNRAYRFNIDTESFMGTNSVEACKDKNFYVSQIIPTESGRVWLLSEKEGCISIMDSLFNAEVYNANDHNLTGNFVHTIYEDIHRNSWILTDKGLTFLSVDGPYPLFYFNELSESRLKEETPFFSVMEFGNELWFGSSKGVVWIYNQNRGVFEKLSTELASDIISIQEISSEKILILSNHSGFVIYTTHDGSMDVYNNKTFPEMHFDEIMTAYIDGSKNIWLEIDRLGVSKFNPYTGKYLHYAPYVESAVSSVFLPNFFIFEDRENRLWVHPRGGGFSLYDKTKEKLIPFYNEPSSPRSMFSNMLHSAYSDRQGNLWMCSRSPGLEKVIFHDDSSFKALLINNDNSTISNEVRPVFEDSYGNIWAATKDGKIHVYNAGLKEKGILTWQGEIGKGTPLNGIAYCITEDSDQNIWIGTKGEGVYKLIRRNRGNSFEVRHFSNDPSDKYSLNNNDVYSIFEDKNKNIWIGTYGGGLNLVLASDEGKFINHLNDLTRFPVNHADRVRIISEDKHRNICVGTTLGFIMFDADFEKPQDIDFKIYTRNNSDSNTIGANDIMDICTTQSGETFIGTFGGGITRIDSTDQKGFPVTFEIYNSIDGLPSDIILSILEDNNGNLWIGSERGLAKFNRDKQTFENFSEIKRLMKRSNFSENSRWRLQDGRMIFGSLRGIVVFDPQNVKNNTFNPYLALVQFKLFNRNVIISPEGLLKRNIDGSDNLVLKHNQNFIGIEFAALDYVDPGNILYMYKLDGFDKEWIYSGNQRIAGYTNLSRGKYLFRVKSTNSDGVWADNERTLAIEVLPPFWETGWAYLAYSFIAALLLYFTYSILYAFYKMRNKIVLEKRESEIKTKFFTNISHEIRTPLTMIVSPIDNLLQSKSTSEPVRKQLEMVSKNTNRLLNMVNQILDFQKISQTPLTVRKIEIGAFVKNLYGSYSKNAELKKIDYRFENKAGNRFIWADVEAFEKIMFNLLSNAFKYTPSGGTIHVSVFNEHDNVAIQVKDTGTGISKDKQARLFKRFASFNEDKSKPSTGIGLSIVKEMADKHKATITVESEDQKGSCFTVFFRKGTDHFGTDVIFDDTFGIARGEKAEESAWKVGAEFDYEEEDNHPSVLIVEDDDDLRQFIRSILEDEYEVHEAANGKEGFEKALELIPDFIVSDIMMPETDGIELLENVRNNILTSHVLFLLLTAKTTLESKLEGFEHGADEYISKPFSVSFFKARVKNLLCRRSELQKYYRERSFPVTGTPMAEQHGRKDVSVNKKDMDFIRSVNAFIEEHLGDDDFVIGDMAVEAGMSRSVFFKKLKGLTGLAPVEYVREVLMQHAAKFLVNSDYTVKEISFMIGMNDSKYFAKCFKKKYDIPPSEYRKKYKMK